MEAIDKPAARTGTLLVTVATAGSVLAMLLVWLPGRLDALLGPGAGQILVALAAAGGVGALLARLHLRLAMRRDRATAAPGVAGPVADIPSAAVRRARARAARLAAARSGRSAESAGRAAGVSGTELDFSHLGAHR